MTETRDTSRDTYTGNPPGYFPDVCLSCEERLSIYQDWVKEKERINPFGSPTVDDLLRRITLETYYKMLKAGYARTLNKGGEAGEG